MESFEAGKSTDVDPRPLTYAAKYGTLNTFINLMEKDPYYGKEIMTKKLSDK